MQIRKGLWTGAVSAAVLLRAGSTAAAVLPPHFQESTVFSGLNQPTAVKFARDGRVFVAEKSGLIKVFPSLTSTTPTVFADLRTNVHNFWDRGLLGLELHPNFPATPYVYALYTVDRKPGGTIPTWGTPGADSDGCPTPPGPTSSGCPVTARLSRLSASGSVMTGIEVVLIENWCQQFPSHSIGGLAFGPDGALYVSGGEGANFNAVDYGQFGGTGGTARNVCGDPPVGVGGTQTPPGAEGGALRSQSVLRPSGQPVVLGGAILRLGPTNGQAMPDNPLASSPNLNARRIIAHGFRNPFRFAMRPGTSEIWVGDVGWNSWEEIDRFDRAEGRVPNFGWPCYEGPFRQAGYDAADLTQCETLYATNGAVDSHHFAYGHTEKVVANETCPTGSSSVSGLAFYTSGSYPGDYDGALFFTDYNRRCIWAMMPDGSGTPSPGSIVTFAAGLSGGSVNLQIGPGGDLFYVDYDGGRIQRIRYFGANQPPTADASADQTSGAAPLGVQFDGTGSSDPDGDALSYAWDLDGDGVYDDSTAAAPSYTFEDPGQYTVHLQVTDPTGATSTTALSISANNTPPTANIAAPLESLAWKVGDTISFSGSGTDPQEDTLPASSMTWVIVLQHCPSNCHAHTLQTLAGVASGSFVAPDHEYPSYLQVRLSVVDSGGLAHTKTVSIQPQTVDLTFASSPPGLQLAVDAVSGAAPFTRTVIVGSSHSVSAPAPQLLGADTYSSPTWSDGGAQTHTIVAPQAAATYTASYVPISADLAVTQSASPSPVTVTAPLTYTMVVTNRGPATQTGVTLSDTLPPAVAFVSSNPASPTCALASGTLTCALGSMASGESRTVSVVVRPSATGTLTSTAAVSGAEPDSNPANDSATTSTTVKPQPAVAITDVTRVEGGPGTTTLFSFTVTLSVSSTQVVSVRYASANGTAGAPADYGSVAGTLVFNPTVTTRTVSVAVFGESEVEADETFVLNLTVPVNATIADAQGLATILNDDQ